MGPSCRARGAGAAPSPTPAAPTRPSGPCPATPSHARARRRRGRAPRPGWSRAPRLRLGGAPARDPGVGTEEGGGGGRRRGPGWEGEGPTAAPSPAWDSRPGLPAGVTSRLQPEGTPPATPEPARLLTRTPPLSSLLAPRTRPASAPAAGPPRLPPPPSAGFQIEIP